MQNVQWCHMAVLPWKCSTRSAPDVPYTGMYHSAGVAQPADPGLENCICVILALSQMRQAPLTAVCNTYTVLLRQWILLPPVWHRLYGVDPHMGPHIMPNNHTRLYTCNCARVAPPVLLLLASRSCLVAEAR
jgi:hypothetical protein